MTLIDWPSSARTGAPRDYWPKVAATITQDRVKKQSEWHALPVGWEQLDYPNFLEKRRDLIADVIRKGFERLWKDDAPQLPSTLAGLIEAGESQTLEFKSTFRWNVHTLARDTRLEHAVTKTVCGFLNAEGGKLLIGVDDRGDLVGLMDDMRTLAKKGNRDGYELYLRQHLDNNLSIHTAGMVSIDFEQSGHNEVCVVSIHPSGKPVFSKPLTGSSGPSEFWVRVGNATSQLYGMDMLDYQRQRWG